MTGRIRRRLVRSAAVLGIASSLVAGSAGVASADATVSGTGSS